MIDCELFRSFNELLQARILASDGIRLMGRSTGRVNVDLYALYKFYVEVYYDKNEDDPLYIKAFELGPAMDIYLEVLVIDSIFEKIR